MSDRPNNAARPVTNPDVVSQNRRGRTLKNNSTVTPQSRIVRGAGEASMNRPTKDGATIAQQDGGSESRPTKTKMAARSRPTKTKWLRNPATSQNAIPPTH